MNGLMNNSLDTLPILCVMLNDTKGFILSVTFHPPISSISFFSGVSPSASTAVMSLQTLKNFTVFMTASF